MSHLDLFGNLAATKPPDARAPVHGRERAAVRPATGGPLDIAAPVDPRLRLGTSSWAFPGWQGIVYGDLHSEALLSRQGLVAYAAHSLLRTVSIDRGFYRALPVAAFRDYAAQVPDDFRFTIKAPSAICDSVLRDDNGRSRVANAGFLDPVRACETFVEPCLEGLGARAGPLVFQLSPIPPAIHGGAASFADRLAAFLEALPSEVAGRRPLYAVELRNPELLTPRVVRAIGRAGARLCLALHAQMPGISRQAAALGALDGTGDDGEWQPAGPLVVRWNLLAGATYEGAKAQFRPFDRLVQPDVRTRTVLARLARRAIDVGQDAWILANNKAEGSAPLSLRALYEALLALRDSGAAGDLQI